MSKLSFRARALDASKPMPIYLAEELPDLPDYSAINRAVPQMPSGMEKEEESEHHLQRAISGTGLIIPTPEVCEVTDLEFYERCYPPDYKMPKQHIHMQPLWEEQEAPEYDIDSEDERWLKQQRHPELTELLFEQMMDKLEKCSGQTVVTLNEAKLLLERKDDLVIAVYDYWLNKRLNTQHPLILCVKTESRPGQSTNNPYLAFRRRTEKMQTRKNRKNDESSYEKMLKLRRDLARALSLLQLVARREQAKRDLVRLTAALAGRRYRAGDFALLQPDPPPRAVYSMVPLAGAFRREPFAVTHYPPRAPPTPPDLPRQREKRPYKRRKHRHHPAGAQPPPREGVVGTSSEEESSGRGETASPPDPGPFAFRRKPGCFYEMPTSTLSGDPVDSERAPNEVMYEHELDVRHRYTLTSVSAPQPVCVGFARRRVGRGGRVLLDRVATPLDALWPRLPLAQPHSTRYRTERDEEVEFETKAHRSPKELSRDYHTSGRYPWRHAFRQHLARNPHLWTSDVKPDPNDVKIDLDDVKIDLDDVKLDVDKCSDLPQDSDISLRTIDDLNVSDKCLPESNCEPSGGKNDPSGGKSDPSGGKSDHSGGKCDPSEVRGEIDSFVRANLNRVMRKRSWSCCSDTSYDSDESLYPVEREFEKFFNEVNKKWLHFRPKTPPPSPPPHDDLLPLASDAPFTVELRPAEAPPTGDLPSTCLEPFFTTELTLAELYGVPDGEESSENLIGGVAEVPAVKSGVRQAGQRKDDFLSQGQGLEGRAGPGSLGCSTVRLTAHGAPPRVQPQVERPPTPPKKVQTPVKEKPERAPDKTERPERAERPDRAEPSPVPNSRIIVEEVNEVPTQMKAERKKPAESIPEVVVAPSRHSPLKKHVITSAPRRANDAHDAPQILTVAVSDSLKVRLQNHLLQSQAGGGATVVGLVQNGPFVSAGGVAVALPQPRDSHPTSVVSAAGVGGVGVGGGARRVAGGVLQLGAARGLLPAPPVVLAHSHTIHHVAPNKLKVLHAHPLTHNQRNQLLAQNRSIAQLPAVVSLATLGEAKTTTGAKVTGAGSGGSVAQLFEIKGTPLGKGAQLLNVVRPAARARLELADAKKRHLVATFDPAALKGNLSGVTGVAGAGAGVTAARGRVSLDARQLVRAQLPAVRAQQPRHQIHLKNRTFQVHTSVAPAVVRSSPSPSTSVGGAASGKPAALPGAVVANLLHKNVHLPKGGQKIAISSVAGGVPGGVQAIALSAAQLKARAPRLVPPRTHHAHHLAPQLLHGELADSGGGAGGGTASGAPGGATDGATNGAVRTAPPDTLSMEVT